MHLRIHVIAAVAVLLAACGDTATDPTPPTATTLESLVAVVPTATGLVAVGHDRVALDGVSLPGTDSTLILTSSGGGSWSRADLRRAGYLSDVAHGGGISVAVGRGETGPLVLVSSDDRTWEAVPDPPGPTGWHSVAFGNGRFVAAALDAGPLLESLLVSDDGFTWTLTAETDLLDVEVAYGDGVFLAYGSGGAVGRSPDGTDWSVVPVPEVTRVDVLVHGPDGWVGSGMFDLWFGELPERVGHFTLRSTIAGVWQARARDSGRSLLDLAVGDDGTLVAIADGGLHWSLDGLDWNPAAGGVDGFQSVSRADGGFVAVGSRSIATSSDGHTWSVIRVLGHAGF